MRKFLLILIVGCFYTEAWATEKLPDLLNQAPTQSFEILGPLSATKKSVDEAQIELLHQGQKLDADAVILKDCKAGSIQREGLTWYKAQAACEGLAIRFGKQNSSPQNSLPTKAR